jgi:hypothetical protein
MDIDSINYRAHNETPEATLLDPSGTPGTPPQGAERPRRKAARPNYFSFENQYNYLEQDEPPSED